MTKPPRPCAVRASTNDLDAPERQSALRARLESYVPTCLEAARWEGWRSRVIELALACRPTNDYAAVGLARTLTEVIAAEEPDQAASWAEVLSDGVIAAQAGRLRRQVDAPTLQQRLSMLRRLQRTALGLPQIPRGASSSCSAGMPWSEPEVRRLWARAGTASPEVTSMLRYRLAVEVIVGVDGPEAGEVNLVLTDAGASATDRNGRPLVVAPGWASVIRHLSGGDLPRPHYDHRRLRAWLRSSGLVLGRSRGRDAYLREVWGAARSALEGLRLTRATYSDVERLVPALHLPGSASTRGLLRGRPPVVGARGSNDDPFRG